MILDFFVNVVEINGIPIVSMSRQLISLNDQLNNPIYRALKRTMHVHAAICLSPGDVAFTQSCDFIDYDIPPLIHLSPNVRRVCPRTCLVYIRDSDQCGLISQLIANNPDVTFNVFTEHLGLFCPPNRRIRVHRPGPGFKKHFATTQVMITSSGVESICEAIFHRIPIVVIKPACGDEEQTFNYNYYITHEMAIPFSPSLALAKVRRPIFKHTDWFISYCLTTERRVLDVVDKAMKTQPVCDSSVLLHTQQASVNCANILRNVWTMHSLMNQLVNRAMMRLTWRLEN
jgi:hypothetical protein